MKQVKISFNLNKTLIRRATKQSMKKGTFAALDHLLAVSKQEVPLDQGPLRASGVVDVASDGSAGTVSYDTPYAVRQHEELGYRHQRGRKAKYLEDPCNDSSVHSGMMAAAQKAMESDWE